MGGKNAFATKNFDSCGRTDANTEFPIRVSAFGGVDVGIATYLPAIIQISTKEEMEIIDRYVGL